MKNTFLEPVIAQNKHVILVSNKVRLGGLKIKLIQYFFFWHSTVEVNLHYNIKHLFCKYARYTPFGCLVFSCQCLVYFWHCFFYQLIPFFILLSCDLLFISGGMNLLSIIYSLFIIAEFVSILNSLHIIWFIKIFHKDTS